MYKWEDLNVHKTWKDEELNLEYFISKFMEVLHQTGYVTIQRYKTAKEMFTARNINGVIVAGNTSYLEDESSPILPEDTVVVSFDRLWVFKEEKKLENYLKFLLQNWEDEDACAGNVESEKDFYRRLELWDDTQFYRTGWDGSCKWNDTTMEYALGFRKPKELMEKLTGDNLENWG